MLNKSLEHGLSSSYSNYPPQPALERIAQINMFDERCEAHQALEYIANKWTVLILFALIQGTKRYSQLQQQIFGISPKMLIQNLRNLERCGLVERLIYPVMPPKVEYSLSPLGKTLIEPLAILGEWAYTHIHEIKAANARYELQLAQENSATCSGLKTETPGPANRENSNPN